MSNPNIPFMAVVPGRPPKKGNHVDATLTNDDGDIDVNNPLSVDGDSIYPKDIDIDRSLTTNWVGGTIVDLFQGLHTQLTNTTSDNPKLLRSHLQRTTKISTITLGEAEGEDFSNVKITVFNPGAIPTVIVDESSDDAKYTSREYNFDPIIVESIKYEFFTSDAVSLTYIHIPKLATISLDGNNEEDPVHVNDTDHASRIGQNTVFGDRIIGIKKPSMAFQYNYGFRARDFNITETNGGTAGVTDSLFTVSTGTNVAGEAIAESVEYLRYIPGNEAYMFFTAAFTEGKADSYQRAGLYDDDDGFFIGYEDTQFTVTRRRSGVDENISIDITKVFPLEAFDPTMGNVYKISFGYLGFATIIFEVMDPRGFWIVIHKIKYPNTSTETNIGNTNLPVRGEVANTGNNTDISISNGSLSTGIVNGGGEDPGARPYAYNLGTTAVAAATNNIVGFRNVTTFADRTNRISAVVQLLSAATELNKPVVFEILIDPTITVAGSWSAADPDSILEVNTTATINRATGTSGMSWGLAKIDSFFEIVEALDLFIRPGQTAFIITTLAAGGTGDIEFSTRWKELF